MRYVEFRDAIEGELRRHRTGWTWKELRDRLDLPYERPCPTWVAKLENEIGLERTRGGALFRNPAAGPRPSESPPGKAPRRCDAGGSIGEKRERRMVGSQPVEARRGFESEPEGRAYVWTVRKRR